MRIDSTWTSRRTLGVVLSTAMVFLSGPSPAADSVTLVPTRSLWKYSATGRQPATNWTSLAYSDEAWPQGPAQLGYGDGDEATTVPFGPDTNSRYITTYFRRSVMVPEPLAFNQITLRVLRDDGVAVYLNGHEVFRNNLPGGPLRYETLALTNVTGGAERAFYTTTFPAGRWLESTNLVAVEIHQVTSSSADLSFDLEMLAEDANERMRGPYLQLGRTNGGVIRWRTAVPTDTLARCGTNRDDLNLRFHDPALVTEHVIACDGLQPATRYYYSIGSSGAENLREYFTFMTSPLHAKPTRLWAIGDAGSATSEQEAVRDAYLAYAQGRHTDVWLMLGDNAYGSGTDQQYQAAVFEMYSSLLTSTFVWPAIGNHDTYSATSSGRFPYLDIFTLPAAGEAGGVASGTEKYYSFDYGNIHFVCLDAMSSDRSRDGPMGVWLQTDLAATTAEWTIAYWHHPPYTRGSHNSDLEGELIEMRENMVPILESFGVDLVLCGHSHSYERSFLLNGHYSFSDTLLPSMLTDEGDGREDGTGPYRKPPQQGGQGTVYVVAGSAGLTSGGSLNHPAMFASLNRLGSLVIDIDGLRLDARFLRETGEIDDAFTILKTEDAGPLRVVHFYVRDGQVELLWTSEIGATYRVEKHSRLDEPIWLSASGEQVATGLTSFWSEPLDSGAAQSFYRIVRVP